MIGEVIILPISICDLYQKIKAIDEPKLANRYDSKDRVSWVPILEIGHDHSMGISSEGYWVLEASRGLVIIGNCPPYYYVSLLEKDIDLVKNELSLYFKENDLVANVEDIFPFVDIIRAGFESQSDYWRELAFNWYSKVKLDSKKLLIDSLSQIVKNKGKQSTRHNAVKGLRQAGVEHEIIDNLIKEYNARI